MLRGIKTCRDLYLLGHDPSVVPARLFEWMPRNGNAAGRLPSFTAVWMLAASGLTLGIRARVVCRLCCARCRSRLHLVDQNFWGHHVYFMTLMLLLLTMTDSDASLSGRWIREGRPERDVLSWPDGWYRCSCRWRISSPRSRS